MNADLVETFLDLVQTRSFNQTADRLGLTQSTVSARIAALERITGRKLFKRSRAGTELTPAGRSFAPHARALRHAWAEALRATRADGDASRRMRIGLQIDLAGAQIGGWANAFRTILPQTAFHFELDYSTQMCSDVAAGQMDLAILYSPRGWADLHFESLGEVRYRMVSSRVVRCADITTDSYIRGDFSAIFTSQHQSLFPQLTDTPLACGQSASVVGLLTSLGGTAYVVSEDAAILLQNGFQAVEDAPDITQTIYSAVHVRHRHAHTHRRLIAAVRRQLDG